MARPKMIPLAESKMPVDEKMMIYRAEYSWRARKIRAGDLNDPEIQKLQKESQTILAKWGAVFNAEYSKWQAEGYDPETTFPRPSPPGFSPTKQKALAKQRQKILADVKKNLPKRIKHLEKRKIMKRKMGRGEEP